MAPLRFWWRPSLCSRRRSSAGASAFELDSASGARTQQRVAGAEDKWVMTPMFSPLRIIGTGDVYTVETRINYPNGEVWRGVDIVEFTNGRISKMTGYFAAPFPAAEWRSRWVEKMDDPAQVEGKGPR
jgi:hypothetical protein